jgi:hypothetical protein
MMTRRLSRFVAASSLLGLIALAGASVTDDSHRLMDDPAAVSDPVVQVWGARTLGIKGLFGVHTWIAVKPSGVPDYTVYEVIGWRLRWTDTALVARTRAPDRWFGSAGELYAEKRGAGVDEMIKRIDQLASEYPYAKEYTLWPGPNSNTFVAWVTRQIPELKADLPATAIGKDYLGGRVLGAAPSGSGFQFSLAGLLGFSASRVEGLELNLLSLNFGVGPSGLKLPLVGRIGTPRIDTVLELVPQVSAEAGHPGTAN